MTDTLTLSPTQTLKIISSTPDALTVESTWSPGPSSRPARHFHPHQRETFHVLAGVLAVELGTAAPRLLHPGDTIDVPARTAHRMWNGGPTPARATWRISPPQRTEEMFRYIDGGLSPRRLVIMLWSFRREFRLSLRR